MSVFFTSCLAAVETVEESEEVIEEELSELNLKKGRIFILGHVAFMYEVTERSITPQQKFWVLSDIGVGYFFFDRIALGAMLPIKLSLGAANKGIFGVSLFGTYFFKFNKFNNIITPYAGLDLSPAFSVNEQAFRLGAGINAGVLVSLSSNLALDFGITPEVYFPLNNRQKWKFELPIGFVGIRAFF